MRYLNFKATFEGALQTYSINSLDTLNEHAKTPDRCAGQGRGYERVHPVRDKKDVAHMVTLYLFFLAVLPAVSALQTNTAELVSYRPPWLPIGSHGDEQGHSKACPLEPRIERTDLRQF